MPSLVCLLSKIYNLDGDQKPDSFPPYGAEFGRLADLPADTVSCAAHMSEIAFTAHYNRALYAPERRNIMSYDWEGARRRRYKHARLWLLIALAAWLVALALTS